MIKGFIRPAPRNREFYGLATAQSIELDRLLEGYLEKFEEMRRHDLSRIGKGSGEELEIAFTILRSTLSNLTRLIPEGLSRGQIEELLMQITGLISEGFLIGTNLGGALGQVNARRPLVEGAKKGGARSVAIRRSKSENGWEVIALSIAKRQIEKQGQMVRDHLASDIINLWTSEEVKCVGHGSLLKFLIRMEERGELPSRKRACRDTEAPSPQ